MQACNRHRLLHAHASLDWIICEILNVTLESDSTSHTYTENCFSMTQAQHPTFIYTHLVPRYRFSQAAHWLNVVHYDVQYRLHSGEREKESDLKWVIYGINFNYNRTRSLIPIFATCYIQCGLTMTMQCKIFSNTVAQIPYDRLEILPTC